MTGHDRGGGWVVLSTLCNLGWDGCYEPDCLCRCHDEDRAEPALSTPPDTEGDET